MKQLVILMISIAVFAGCGENSAGPETGTEGEMTYTVEGFTFSWQQDMLSNDSLVISITAPTTGWVAVGFQPSALMQDANLIIGYVDSGIAFVRDDFGTGPTTHESDTDLGGSFDVGQYSGTESSTETTIFFKIAYDSGDQYDKVLVEGETYTFIFAHGADGADDYTSAHEWVKSASFEL